MDAADITLRYDWACVEARVHGKEAPASLNGDVVWNGIMLLIGLSERMAVQTGMISNRIHDARSITILKMSWMKISVFALDGKYPFVSMQISFAKTTFILL